MISAYYAAGIEGDKGMPRVTSMQTNFTAGELSPRLLGRVDIARYSNGARRIENAYPVVHGGVKRRPGTRFVDYAFIAHDLSELRVRLIPYIFNETQAYILEFGEGYMRVYKDGAYVGFWLETPYTADMLPELDYVQSADTMFIAHPNHKLRRLRRFDHTRWTLDDFDHYLGPFDEVGTWPNIPATITDIFFSPKVEVSTDFFLQADYLREIVYGAGRAQIIGVHPRYVSVNILSTFGTNNLPANRWYLTGSPNSPCTPSIKGPVNATVRLSLSRHGWRTSDVGKHVRINRGIVKITSVSSTLEAHGTILSELDSTVTAPEYAWSLEDYVWNDRFGYPSTVSLYEQRLVAAGSPSFPQTVWMSRTGDYMNFELGTKDDDAISFTISSDQINPIVHMSNFKTLVALTYGGEFTISGGDRPITPTNIQVKSQSIHGCNNVRPQQIGNELFYVQRAGRKVRTMSYRFDTDSYGSPDVSVLADHMTESGIVDMAYQQDPDSVLWLVRADGVLVSLTVDRDQDVIAWARHVTDGDFESVATIPAPWGDEVWVAVRRIINGQPLRCIERFSPEISTDCAITGTHPTGATVWSGLEHLEGREVEVIADGVLMPRKTVQNGEITIPRAAKKVEIGLPFTTTIETLTPEFSGTVGTIQASSMRVSEVTLRVFETVGAEINGQKLVFRRLDTEVLDSPPIPYTGDYRVETLGWDRGKSNLIIQQKQPLPFHLLSVITKLTVND